MSEAVEKTVTHMSSEMFTRKQHVSLPTAQEFLQLLRECNPKGKDAYDAARKKMKRNFNRLRKMVARQLANSHKQGLQIFPSHFTFMTQDYELPSPSWLQDVSKAELKSATFWDYKLRALTSASTGNNEASERERERDHHADDFDEFVTLIIGLTTAGKIVTHWSTVEDDD